MPKTRKDVRSLIRKQLGRETADAMLKKVDAMAKKGVPSSDIEKAIAQDLAKVMAKVQKNMGLVAFTPGK